MKNKDSVELIEYTKAQDALNCVTHALGAVLGAVECIILTVNNTFIDAGGICT